MQSNFIKSHIIDFIFVIIFLTCLCIPNLHISLAEKSDEENRMLAKYAALATGKHVNWNYGNDLETFYNDRFFCRNKLIQLNSLVKTKIFPHEKYSRSRMALQGKDGWLFYRGDNSELNFLNYDLLTEKQLSQGLKYLKDIKNWCDSNGKVFVFLICPDKNKIYGEYYPDDYKKIRPDNESRAFQFVNYVRANSDVSIVYPYNELNAEKSNERLLYYKNDTHWNYDGAYIGYETLMKEIQKSIDIEQIVNDGFEKIQNLQGDLHRMLKEVKYIPDETTFYYSPKINSTFEYVKGNSITNREGCQTICKYKKYNVFALRDSYTDTLGEFISNTFYEVIYHWRYNITPEDLAYIKNNADVVILECVERFLPDAILNTFPQTELQKSEATK